MFSICSNFKIPKSRKFTHSSVFLEVIVRCFFFPPIYDCIFVYGLVCVYLFVCDYTFIRNFMYVFSRILSYIQREYVLNLPYNTKIYYPKLNFKFHPIIISITSCRIFQTKLKYQDYEMNYKYVYFISELNGQSHNYIFPLFNMFDFHV